MAQTYDVTIDLAGGYDDDTCPPLSDDALDVWEAALEAELLMEIDAMYRRDRDLAAADRMAADLTCRYDYRGDTEPW